MLEHIYWSWGKLDVILSDNGTEFLDEFDVALNRYGIRHKRTTPAHPQTNGKVERWNHELMNRLQRIAAEDGNNRSDWDLYVRQGLFAFHAHYNSRLGCTPFYLQYGIEPKLPSQHSLTSKPLTDVERAKTKENCQQRVKDLGKYRTDAANRYMKAMKRLASSRDDAAFTKGPIIKGDLVMRKPLNRKSKLHPKWDGPFVVLDFTDKDSYQLATANGYVLQTLTNAVRLRKLSSDEVTRYTGQFWHASSRLRLHDQLAKQQKELHDLDVALRKATTAHLNAQRRREPVSLDKHAELSAKRQQVLKDIRDAEANPSAATLRPEISAVQHTRRVIRLPSRYRD